MTDATDTMIGTATVAARAAVTPRTVRRWADRGELPAIRLTARSPRRFRVEDVERFLDRAGAAA